MFIKVHEKKFKTSSDATEYLDSSGWVYIGKKGIIRQYHLYKGVSMNVNGEVVEDHKVRLYADGHVILYNDKSISGTLMAGLPPRVWHSKEIYELGEEILKDFNLKLNVDYDLVYQIHDEGHNNFCLYKLEKQGDSYGKVTIKPSIRTFDSPHKAFAWAVSDLNA